MLAYSMSLICDMNACLEPAAQCVVISHPELTVYLQAGASEPLGPETLHGSSESEGAAEEDGFLVVKRRDVFDAAPAPSAPAAIETGTVHLDARFLEPPWTVLPPSTTQR